MMGKENLRITVSKKIRFEVFKRDAFKCQYCGKTPEIEGIILHIDHMKPVAEGGTNEITNLLTACGECNLGKGKTPLDDKSTLSKSRKQTELLQERREQLEMMLQWREGLKSINEDTLSRICEYWNKLAPGFIPNENGKKELSKLFRKYTVDEVMRAMDVSAEQYLSFKDGVCTSTSWSLAFEKIAGICKWEREFQKNPELRDLFHIRNIAHKRCPNYFNYPLALEWLGIARSWGVTIDNLQRIAGRVRNWSNFNKEIDLAIEEAKANREEIPVTTIKENSLQLQVTFSKDDADEIMEYAEAEGLSAGDYIKKIVMESIDPTTERLGKFWLVCDESKLNKDIRRFKIWTYKPDLDLFFPHHIPDMFTCFYGDFNSIRAIAEHVFSYSTIIYVQSHRKKIRTVAKDVVTLVEYLTNMVNHETSGEPPSIENLSGVCLFTYDPEIRSE